MQGNKLPFGMEGVVLPNFIVLCEFSLYIYIYIYIYIYGHQSWVLGPSLNGRKTESCMVVWYPLTMGLFYFIFESS